MMIHTTNTLALPLLVLAWLVDVFLLNAGLRLLLARLSSTRASRLCLGLQEVIDPLPRWVGHKLETLRHKPAPPWASWALVIGAGLIIRHLLQAIALQVSRF